MSGILEYSTTPASNTAINGIGIAGSNSIKNGDDAMRQMMADTRSAVTRIAEKTAGSYTAAKADYNQLWRVTGAATINLTAAATLTAGWCLWVMADGATATIDPAGSEQINGASTLTLVTGNSALIICTGTDFKAVVFTNPAALGGAAYLNVGTTTGTVAAGDDSRITGALPKSGGTMTGAITLAGDPTSNMQATTKQYVDASAFSHAKEIITTSGTWTKPAGIPDNQPIMVEIWGGGGGATSYSNGYGGGGGAYNRHIFLASELGATETVTVGAGGTGAAAGGTSTFGSKLQACGGGVGDGFTSNKYGGGGGGTVSAGGGPGSMTRTKDYGLGNGPLTEGGVNNSSGAGSIYQGYRVPGGIWGGGAGGLGGDASISINGNGGSSEYGGGGGAPSASGYSPGTSQYGGNGGARGQNGEAPGGGAGGYVSANTTGGRGECRVTYL